MSDPIEALRAAAARLFRSAWFPQHCFALIRKP
jgi:hypothetical protein